VLAFLKIGNHETARFRISNTKLETVNWTANPSPWAEVQSAVSSFGFEMQESCSFEISDSGHSAPRFTHETYVL